MVEPGGQVKGYAIELCNRIADGIREELRLSELKVKYWPVNVNNRVDALLDNKADLECSVTTNTAERRKKVAFTIPHFLPACACWCGPTRRYENGAICKITRSWCKRAMAWST